MNAEQIITKLEIDAMLAEKQQLDAGNLSVNNMLSYDRWVVDAIELLLRIELDRTVKQ
jgi:hypothetical protein